MGQYTHGVCKINYDKCDSLALTYYNYDSGKKFCIHCIWLEGYFAFLFCSELIMLTVYYIFDPFLRSSYIKYIFYYNSSRLSCFIYVPKFSCGFLIKVVFISFSKKGPPGNPLQLLERESRKAVKSNHVRVQLRLRFPSFNFKSAECSIFIQTTEMGRKNEEFFLYSAIIRRKSKWNFGVILS